LGIMNPAYAPAFASEVARALRAGRRELLFADCNAIAPETMHAVNRTITAAGGRCVDGGIIGSPPRGRAEPCRLYVSGPQAGELEQIATPMIEVYALSANIGEASALKMCYAAINKGVQAMVLEIMVAAR